MPIDPNELLNRLPGYMLQHNQQTDTNKFRQNQLSELIRSSKANEELTRALQNYQIPSEGNMFSKQSISDLLIKEREARISMNLEKEFEEKRLAKTMPPPKRYTNPEFFSDKEAGKAAKGGSTWKASILGMGIDESDIIEKASSWIEKESVNLSSINANSDSNLIKMYLSNLNRMESDLSAPYMHGKLDKLFGESEESTNLLDLVQYYKGKLSSFVEKENR